MTYKQKPRLKYKIAHPDECLPKSPCEGCTAKCHAPCQAYLAWYNKRMEIFRRWWT